MSVVVTMTHARIAGYCSAGVRQFFSDHGLDYVEFLRSGIEPNELLERTGGDYLAKRVVEVLNEQQ